jgi:IS4 transposase
VRFRLSDDHFEAIITNLDPDSFPVDELKKLYAMRWGIETSFRKLKYTLGLLSFHAKKVEYIRQEIFARLIMYNFCELITSHITIRQSSRKLDYQVNFSAAVHVCRQFFLGDIPPPLVEALLAKHISPIRPGRSRPRKLKPKQALSFLYRVA